MSDLFGLLELPVPPPDSEDDPVADPLLKMLLSFLKAAINAETGEAWAQVCPGDPLPISNTYAHNPDPAAFNAKRTPALYMWRGADKGRGLFSQGYVADDGPITCLWVPPSSTQDKRKIRQPFSNAIKKALKKVLATGRHPAWVVPGDTYYEPADYGSVLVRHARLSKIQLGEFRDFELIIEMDQNKGKLPFDCVMFSLDVLELLEPGAGDVEEIDHIEGVIKLGTEEPLLEVQQFTFQVQLVEVSPPIGGTSGDDLVEFRGYQFEKDSEFYVGGSLCDDITFVSDTTYTARTPPHAAGLVDVVMVTPSGRRVTLTNGFEYVAAELLGDEEDNVLATEGGDVLIL